jgi:chromosome partitioning protein
MRTIAFVSQKGGSGKSTIASSLAVAAHEMEEKVCVIDMDPQGSLMNWARSLLLERPGCRLYSLPSSARV